MTFDSFFKEINTWGVPALIGTFTGAATILINRRLPFQQKLNEIQFQEVNSSFKEIVNSSRDFTNQLHEVIYKYHAMKDFISPEELAEITDTTDEILSPEECRDLAKQALFQSFLVEKYISPIQYITLSITMPNRIVKAANEYNLALIALPLIAMNWVDKKSPDEAWQMVMGEVNVILSRFADEIRGALGVNELTRMNRYHSNTLLNLFSVYMSNMKNRILKRRPATSYESILYSTKMKDIYFAIQNDLGANIDEKTQDVNLEDVMTPQKKSEGVDVDMIKEVVQRSGNAKF